MWPFETTTKSSISLALLSEKLSDTEKFWVCICSALGHCFFDPGPEQVIQLLWVCVFHQEKRNIRFD